MSGRALLRVPVPCDVGALGTPFQTQWWVAPTTASPCFMAANVSVSNILVSTLGL